MITNKIHFSLLTFTLSMMLTSCSDFLYDDSDQVIYADDHGLTSDADTLWSVAGIMNKMQALADRTILLGEVRGALVQLTAHASADLRQLADFEVSVSHPSVSSVSSASSVNKYDQPRDYYAVINNCNFFIAKADTALRNNRNEPIFQKEYAAVKAFRAWTYLQLALNYQSVPFITEPILSKEQSEQDFPRYDLQQVCQYFITDLAPYADIETPGYESIRNTNSKLFYYPVYVLLGDLCLWSGQYRQAAEYYYSYISHTSPKSHSSLPLGGWGGIPITTNAVRFSRNDSHWMSVTDSWSYAAFYAETAATNAELITMIPCDSIPSEGNYSELRNLFNTNENNDYRASIVPSDTLKKLSAAQTYWHYTSGGSFVAAPRTLDNMRTGDLRLQAAYTQSNNANIIVNGKTIKEYSAFTKYQSRNVHILRRAMVYLRFAEALNRAGYPRFAFQILKRGLTNSVIEQEVLPYYPEADAAWIRSFDFPNSLYVLETTAGLPAENTMGIHARGCGYAAADTTYVMPDDTLITDSLQRQQYQMEHVEDLIIDEAALELAFEGQRFYDLMRVALRRGDPDYLARRVASRSGRLDANLYTRLTDTTNWYLNIEH